MNNALRIEDHLRKIVRPDAQIQISAHKECGSHLVRLQCIDGVSWRRFTLAFHLHDGMAEANSAALYENLLNIVHAKGRYFLSDEELLHHAREDAYNAIKYQEAM